MIAQLLRALACLMLYLVCPSVITSAAALEGGDNGVCEAGEGMMEGGSAEALLCVPQVLVVNLARRADKWRSVSARLRAAGFRNVQRLEAVDGRNLTWNEVRGVLSDRALTTLGKAPRPHRTEDLKDIRTLGAAGCYLSHLQAWQAVVELGLPRALVLEDDVHVDAVAANAWQVVGGGDPCAAPLWDEGADVVLLGFYDGIGRAGVGYHASPLSSAFECPADLDRWRGHAYIVTNRGAAQLIAEALPLDVQVDYYMGSMVVQGLVSCRASYRSIISEPSSHTGNETDVQEDDTSHIRDFLRI